MKILDVMFGVLYSKSKCQKELKNGLLFIGWMLRDLGYRRGCFLTYHVKKVYK
jgi:hypothetical protein